jgi:acyl-CoA synthetase
MMKTRRVVGHSAAEIEDYLARGLWGDIALADVVNRWARENPDGLAFSDDRDRLTWAAYDEESTRLAGALLTLGLERGERMAVLMPDSAAVHVAWLAAEKAGLVVVGVGPRAGDREVAHLVDRAGASVVLTGPSVGTTPSEVVVDGLRLSGRHVMHLRIDDPGRHPWQIRAGGVPVTGLDRGQADNAIEARRLRPSETFMLNSTSGTTGLPKCVVHTQNRWFYFHQLAQDAGELVPSDVFCSAIPSPFGFGLWTAHFTPAVLGAPTHLLSRFSADGLVELLARERVSVLSAVSTQFIMMLGSPMLASADLAALRVMFTGGEAVPFERSMDFERRTGARVLQFYGSNETGALSRTTTRDPVERRLRSAGRVIPEMQVRLVGPEPGEARTAGYGQAACRGPATCEGYFADPAANDLLYDEDGWMLTGDLVEIDDEGYLTVVGRISDIIIRGGKNISAPAVEAEVATHPDVAMVAAVSMPDSVFGERVCVYVQPRAGRTPTLEGVVAHLADRGVSREWFPERLVLLDRLPSASGGKVAKAQLRDDIRRRLAAEQVGIEQTGGQRAPCATGSAGPHPDPSTREIE